MKIYIFCLYSFHRSAYGMECAMELLNHRDKQDKSILDWAASVGNNNLIEYLIRRGMTIGMTVTPMTVSPVSDTIEQYKGPLYYAIESEHIETIRFLLDSFGISQYLLLYFLNITKKKSDKSIYQLLKTYHQKRYSSLKSLLKKNHDSYFHYIQSCWYSICYSNHKSNNEMNSMDGNLHSRIPFGFMNLSPLQGDNPNTKIQIIDPTKSSDCLNSMYDVFEISRSSCCISPFSRRSCLDSDHCIPRSRALRRLHPSRADVTWFLSLSIFILWLVCLWMSWWLWLGLVCGILLAIR